ncbi:MAG: hypothetical protein F6K10_16920 [Moorea sp. SIO2B7]|nr:hypothetical protein [Moorena sp. SIO2B7]
MTELMKAVILTEFGALLNNGMILSVGALSVGEFNSPRVAPLEWASGVELASCQFQSSFNIFSGGQDAHSTPIHSKIQQLLKKSPKNWYIPKVPKPVRKNVELLINIGACKGFLALPNWRCKTVSK